MSCGGSVRALSLYRVCKALCYLRRLWPELSGFGWGYRGISLGFERFGNCPKRFVGWFDFLHEGAPTLISEFPTQLSLRWRARALDLYSGVGYALARHQSCVLLLSIREYRAETSGDPRIPEPPAPIIKFCLFIIKKILI
ncbi:hypothetical protein EVAR_74682_1 [Eumeta japonica]|uniref:Uncharacterized protein n=1 Tax=Eumeta variegata TaxID=151549 RepID=A0A4C1YM73_EUMVA|nr:hypothetical protein EVAR_74682_1 [Eumeta japonica]